MTRDYYLQNIGEIAVQSDECFWIFPSRYTKNRNLDIYSPWFSYLGDEWQFIISPDCTVYENADFYLWRKFRNVLPGSLYTLQLKLKSFDGEQLAFCEEYSNCDYGFQVSNFCTMEDLKDPQVTVCGQIKIFFIIKETHSNRNDPQCTLDGRINEENESRSESNNESEISSEDDFTEGASEYNGLKILSDNLKSALYDKRMSDVVLKVGGHEFDAHKLILAIRSPTFASMFQQDASEKNDNVVNIPDCNAKSFKVFLHYIYSGSIETLSISTVCNVYYAADKYCTNDLKAKCVKFMQRNLSEEIFCDILSISIRHEEVKLRKTCIDFFCANIKRILETVQWQHFIVENPTRANELLILAHK